MKSRIGLVSTLLRKKYDPNQILVRLDFRKALQGCETVLDVGCGVSYTLRDLGVKHSTGFEGYPPDYEKALNLKTHDELVKGDARKLADHFKPKQFDACIAIDVIEHLTKEDGIKLIQAMEGIARKRVVFFTPKGFLPQRHSADDDLQVHLSGWEPSEMRQHGYEVTGQLGPKTLRGEGHVLKRNPRAFWGIVSFFCQIFSIRRNPDKAAAILCVKILGD